MDLNIIAGLKKWAQDNFLKTDATLLPSQLADGHGTPYQTIGHGAPSSTPTSIGLNYLDQDAGKWYKSAGTASSADWKILN